MGQKIHVQIDKDLEDIVPGFLKHRNEDINLIQKALLEDDFPAIRNIGHKMKGNAGGYGFDNLGVIGANMERAAEAGDKGGCQRALQEMITYLENVDIEYV